MRCADVLFEKTGLRDFSGVPHWKWTDCDHENSDVGVLYCDACDNLAWKSLTYAAAPASYQQDATGAIVSFVNCHAVFVAIRFKNLNGQRTNIYFQTDMMVDSHKVAENFIKEMER